MTTTCDKCGQPLGPGVISCKVSALDIRDYRVAVLVLDAFCPGCGEAIVVKLHLVGRVREEEEVK